MASASRGATSRGSRDDKSDGATTAIPAHLSTLPSSVFEVLTRKGFRIIRELGRGSFGVALLVQDLEDNHNLSGTGNEEQLYVIKVIDISGLKEKARRAALGEVEVLRKLSHPNIIGYYGSFIDEPFLYIVLEFADGGDLDQAIRRTKKRGRLFNQDRVLYWFCQVASAMKYVHSKRILHRDLKASNIFLHTKDRIVKLGDFGIARVLTDDSLACTVIGTPYNMSPELINSEPYSYQSDVWALGCILYELCNLRHAFDGQNMCNLVLKVLQGTYAPIDSACFTSELRDLVGWMLRQEPADRPTVQAIIETAIIQSALRRSMDRESSLGVRSLTEAQKLTIADAGGSIHAGAGAGSMPALSRDTSLDSRVDAAAVGLSSFDGSRHMGDLSSPGRRRFSDPFLPVTAGTLRVHEAGGSSADEGSPRATSSSSVSEGDSDADGYRRRNEGRPSQASATTQPSIFPASARSLTPVHEGASSAASTHASRSSTVAAGNNDDQLSDRTSRRRGSGHGDSDLDSTTGMERHNMADIVARAVPHAHAPLPPRESRSSATPSEASDIHSSDLSLSLRSTEHYARLLEFQARPSRLTHLSASFSNGSPDGAYLAGGQSSGLPSAMNDTIQEGRFEARAAARLARAHSGVAVLSQIASAGQTLLPHEYAASSASNGNGTIASTSASSSHMTATAAVIPSTSLHDTPTSQPHAAVAPPISTAATTNVPPLSHFAPPESPPSSEEESPRFRPMLRQRVQIINRDRSRSREAAALPHPPSQAGAHTFLRSALSGFTPGRAPRASNSTTATATTTTSTTAAVSSGSRLGPLATPGAPLSSTWRMHSHFRVRSLSNESDASLFRSPQRSPAASASFVEAHPQRGLQGPLVSRQHSEGFILPRGHASGMDVEHLLERVKDIQQAVHAVVSAGSDAAHDATIHRRVSLAALATVDMSSGGAATPGAKLSEVAATDSSPVAAVPPFSTPETRNAFHSALEKMRGVFASRKHGSCESDSEAHHDDGAVVSPRAVDNNAALLSLSPTVVLTLNHVKAVRDRVDAAATHLSMAANFKDMLLAPDATPATTSGGNNTPVSGSELTGARPRHPSRARLLLFSDTNNGTSTAPTSAAAARALEATPRATPRGVAIGSADGMASVDSDRAAAMAEYLTALGVDVHGNEASHADVVIAVPRVSRDSTGSCSTASGAVSDTADAMTAPARSPVSGASTMDVPTPALHSPDTRHFAAAALERGSRISGRISLPLGFGAMIGALDGGSPHAVTGSGTGTHTPRVSGVANGWGGSRRDIRKSSGGISNRSLALASPTTQSTSATSTTSSVTDHATGVGMVAFAAVSPPTHPHMLKVASHDTVKVSLLDEISPGIPQPPSSNGSTTSSSHYHPVPALASPTSFKVRRDRMPVTQPHGSVAGEQPVPVLVAPDSARQPSGVERTPSALSHSALLSLAAELPSPVLRALARLASGGAMTRTAPAPLQVRDPSHHTGERWGKVQHPHTTASTPTTADDALYPVYPHDARAALPPPHPALALHVHAPLSPLYSGGEASLPPLQPPHIGVAASTTSSSLEEAATCSSPHTHLPQRPLLRVRSDGMVAPLTHMQSPVDYACDTPSPTCTEIRSTAAAAALPSVSTGSHGNGSVSVLSPPIVWRKKHSRRHSTGSSANLLLANAPEGRARVTLEDTHSAHVGVREDASLDDSAQAEIAVGAIHVSSRASRSSRPTSRHDSSWDTHTPRDGPQRFLADPMSAMEHLAYKIDTMRWHTERSIGPHAFLQLYNTLLTCEVDEGSGRTRDLPILNSSADAGMASALLRATNVSERGLESPTATGSPGHVDLNQLSLSVGPENVARVQLLLGYEDQLAWLHRQVVTGAITSGPPPDSSTPAATT